MKVSKGSIVVGINPYNHKKRKFKFLGKNKGVGKSTHPICLYDYKEDCNKMVTKGFIKLWQVKPYE